MRRIYRTLAVLSLTVSLATIPMTAYASQWQQDSTGWKVQADDGTYLMNQWYQNTDGKWYYIGADGYMLVNAITPDGYQVGADGVWIQPVQSKPVESKPAPQPEINNPVQQPEVNNNTNTDTTGKPADVTEQEWQEWLEFEESIKGGTGKVNDVGANGGHAGYDDSGEINIGGY